MSNIARQSSGLRTVYSIGRVLRSPSIDIAAARETLELGARRGFFVGEQSGLAKGNRAQIFHRARGEIRNRDQVELVAGILEPVVAGKIFERERANLPRPTGQRLLAGNVNDPERRARIDRRGRIELADDERDQVGGHRDRLLEDDLLLCAGQLPLALLSAVRDGGQVLIDNQRHLVTRLELRLVPARERAARVSGFELRRRSDVGLAGSVLVLAAIKAVQLVVQDSAKRNLKPPFARRKFLAESEMRTFLGRLLLGLRGERYSAALRGDLVDFQLERVQHDVVGRIVDDDSDIHLALKGERLEIGRQTNFIALGRDVFRQAIIILRISEGRSILITHLVSLPLYAVERENVKHEKVREARPADA